MTLVVTSYGVHLSKDGNCIVAQGKDGKRQYYSADKIEAVILTEQCGLTTGVIQLCMEHDIPLVMQGGNGAPAWSVEAFSGGSAPVIRRRQLELQHTQTGLMLAKELEAQKLENRSAFMRELAWESGGAVRSMLLEAADMQKQYSARILELEGENVLSLRGSIQGIEGSAGRGYFTALSALLPEQLGFCGRSTRGASDPFNMLLNYGYGILYQYVRKACVAARLDPYIGILHADQYNKPTLTYDLIEPFRHLAERAAYRLCSNSAAENLPDWTPSSEALPQSCRQAMMQALFTQLRRTVRRDSRRITNLENISTTARSIAKRIYAAPQEAVWKEAI